MKETKTEKAKQRTMNKGVKSKNEEKRARRSSDGISKLEVYATMCYRSSHFIVHKHFVTDRITAGSQGSGVTGAEDVHISREEALSFD